MDAIFSYLVKVTVSSGIFTGYYWFVLRNKKFHQYNRFYLLSSILLSLFLPLVNLHWFSVRHSSYLPVDKMLTIIGTEPTVSTEPATGQPASLNWLWLLLAGGILISMINLRLLVLKIIRIYRLKQKYGSVWMKGFHLIETDLGQAPFSFLNLLFWRNSISMEDENGKKILTHELTHIREKHTYDKLFSQVVASLLWINPFYWIIQKELNLIHEFIADERSLGMGDGASFAQMLLQSHNGGRYLDPSHTFFQSPIKRRLFMITNFQKTPFSYQRRLLALPVVVLVTILFSFSIAKGQSSPPSKTEAEKAETQKKFDEEKFFKNLSPAERAALDKKRKDELLQKATKIINNPPEALYLINGAVSSLEDVKKLDPAAIKNMDVKTIKEKEAYTYFLNSDEGKVWVSKYGEIVKKGIVEFYTK